MQYILEVSDTYDDLFRDYPALVKQTLDTAVFKALMDLHHKVLERESRVQPMSRGFQGTAKT